ncbi:MAG: hypothetical protein CMH26_08960 [Micavibrio sp.]|nr:hypothetical protein [Micavibrio sp.]
MADEAAHGSGLTKYFHYAHWAMLAGMAIGVTPLLLGAGMPINVPNAAAAVLDSALSMFKGVGEIGTFVSNFDLSSLSLDYEFGMAAHDMGGGDMSAHSPTDAVSSAPSHDHSTMSTLQTTTKPQISAEALELLNR